ncbi:Crp/Fnr family transcriptional regulator [Croceivirga sp. JEA036]|uniref:Crp/Fnr family transcriptional regulator n=1 Tax=Croceivirga sp. JEA036 TaxID=2721162 RepID=UPI001439B5D4|nr:Crp/Fnr family transcriptional regulator [Croceivirga sp. JEA036]NJB37755.1 Crp/Fnr family transcriptional regulator [Croceivirga sp. JEA036]
MINLRAAKSANFLQFNLLDHLREQNIATQGKITELIVPKGNHIYTACKKLNFAYEIVEGAVKLGSYTESGQEYIYDVIGHNCFFGNFEYLNNDQFYEFSKAMVDSRIRVYDLAFFKELIAKDKKVNEWFIGYLIIRWCNAEKKIKMANEKGALDKVLYLKEYFQEKVLDCSGQEYQLFDLLTKKDLGDLIGATRQTIANTLRKVY